MMKRLCFYCFWISDYSRLIRRYVAKEYYALSDDELGDSAEWLSPGLKIQAEFYEGSPIGIDMPPSIELTVTQTEPSLKGATVSNVNKPATLENGVTIQVPPFVNEGDRIRVDPTEGRYIERAK